MIQIAALYAKIGADTGDFNRGMNGVDDRLHKTGKGFNALGAAGGLAFAGLTVAAVAGAAAVGALGLSIVNATKSAAAMEQQIADIGAVMGLSGREMEAVGALISDLGLDPKLKVSATEAGEAIEALGKNGLTLMQIMNGAARSTVLLANSTGGTFGQAADIATSAMAQFGIKAEEMQSAVNQIVGVTVKSKFTIDDYALAIAQAGGVAASVGVSFTDFNTTIAAISPLFASGSDAGTSFKTFLQTLIPKSKDAEKRMRELGLITEDGANQFFDATGKMKSMAQVAGVLKKAFTGLSDAQKNEAASTIFGTDAMRAAFALAGMTTEQFTALQTEIGKTDAAGAAAKRMNTLAGAFEIFQGVLETVSIAIGMKFIPVATEIARWATEVLTQYGPQLITWFGDLASVAGQFADRLMTAFDTGGLAGVGKELASMAQAWAGVFGAWTVDLWRTQLLPGLTGMITNLLAWVTAPSTWQGIATGLAETWTFLSQWAAGAWKQVAPLLAEYASNLMAFSANLLAWVTAPSTWQGIATGLAETWTFLSQWAAGAWKQVAPLLAEYASNLMAFSANLLAWVTAPTTWGKILTAIKTTWTGFTVWADALWTQIQPSLNKLSAELRAWIDTNAPTLSTWLDVFAGLTADISRGWGQAWPAIALIVYDATTSIEADFDRIQTSLAEIGGWFTGGAGIEFRNSWQTVFTFVAGVISNAVSSSVNNLANLVEAISVAGSALQALGAGDWGALKELSGQLTNLAAEVGKNMLMPFGGPDIPGRASGGRAGGMTLVGERGPELVNLPGDSYVYDAAETADMLAPGAGRLDLYIHGESALPLDRQKLRALAVELRKEFNRSGVMVFA